tara:strand:- start:79 stop:534 length:456 start_codon:yes stop_codon:yes gene_type:complete
MKKAVILLVIAVLTSLSIYRVVEMYVSRPSDYEDYPNYPNGPTVNGEDLHTNHRTATFYTSANMEKDSLFTGISVRFHPNGELLVKAGIKNGKFHGPFDSWYENGRKEVSLVWMRGEKVKNFKAYYPNGKRISGNQRELAEKVFGNAITIE